MAIMEMSGGMESEGILLGGTLMEYSLLADYAKLIFSANTL